MDINELIGKRLAQLVDDRQKREDFIGKMGWESQAYYEARIGRRVFRVAELAAMARASGKQAWQFVDGQELAKSVTLGVGSKPITSAALLDLFRASGPAQGPGWWALNEVREALSDLAAASKAVRKANGYLRIYGPDLPVLEEESE